MADNERLICASASVVEQGAGFKFPLPEYDERTTGFVVRYQGQVFAYVNRCAHVPVELDWNDGDFFDLTRHYLICATHGAHYLPNDGHCVMGPCKGKKLEALKVVERDEQIFLIMKV